MNRTDLLHTLLIVALGHCAALNAATAYKWVDENGMTHYSDRPPGPATSVTSFEIDERGYATSAALQESDRFYSIANQWKRINAERLQRQQLALQEAALEAAKQATSPAPPPEYQDRSYRNSILYSRRAYRRHGYHNGRHYLHSYRPGGIPPRAGQRSIGFPTSFD